MKRSFNISKVLVIFCGTLLSPVVALACQPCTPLILQGSRVRIVLSPQLVERGDVLITDARIRVSRVRKLGPDEKPRQSLSCLTSYEVGDEVLSTRTDKKGTISLKQLPAGTYWLAIRGSVAQAVYVIEIPDGRKQSGTLTLTASDGGLVNNKCGIEPIEYFFK